MNEDKRDIKITFRINRLEKRKLDKLRTLKSGARLTPSQWLREKIRLGRV